MEYTRPEMCIPTATATITLQSIVVYIRRYAGERTVMRAHFIKTTSDGEQRVRGVEGRMWEETERRYPGDDVDGFSYFISVPSGKYRTTVLFKLGHDRLLAYPPHFITAYPLPCSMAYSLNRTCAHPGWRVAMTRFCNMATNIHAASVRKLPHVNRLKPRI
jgi:hypothetical protein